MVRGTRGLFRHLHQLTGIAEAGAGGFLHHLIREEVLVVGVIHAGVQPECSVRVDDIHRCNHVAKAAKIPGADRPRRVEGCQLDSGSSVPRWMKRPKNTPNSNRIHMGMANSDWEIMSGGVSSMPKMKQPTMI